MPVLRFRAERLARLVGLDDPSDLEEVAFKLKGEAEWGEEGYVYIELNPDRPDMYIGEGFARAARGLLGLAAGYQRPETVESGVEVRAGRVASRPYVAAAVVYNVNVDGEYLEELIQFQEKLHDTIGRRRRKAAIGLHDLAKLPDRRVEYVEVNIREAEMEPLHGGGRVSVAEVLEGTEQGQRYGRLALAGERHPALVAGGEIIAVPPVINSDVTRVEPGTRDLFIDVTGTDPRAVLSTLEVLVAGLAERPGARVGLVRLEAPGMPGRTPAMESRVHRLSAAWASRLLGVELGPGELARLLERARHNARPLDSGEVEVEVPPYRVDVLGPIDLVEDAAMMMGYDSLQPRLPQLRTRGGLMGLTLLAREFKKLAVGLGFTQVMQMVLVSPRVVEALGLQGAVEVANPVQAEYSVLRPSLAASLVMVAAENQHAEKPVRVFEVGEVVWREAGSVYEELRAGLAVLDESVSFEDVQAPLYSILRILGVRFTARRAGAPWAIPGRFAVLEMEGGERLGWIGEVHPEVLERLGIEYPLALAEVSLSAIASGEGRFRIRGRATRSP
ncbi:MAG: phenylalanine--tRNA ligase subunit beta [Desulfurococcales archaeon]|nr:phenylalanine--tRNA ligase subunit beta [Desulfurococcales archaeon]